MADSDTDGQLSERYREAWDHTMADARSLAETRGEEEGWETLVVPARDTVPTTDETVRDGLVHVIDDADADEFESLAGGSFSGYDVYRAEEDGRVFAVTELLAPGEDAAVYVVGTFDLDAATDLIRTAVPAELIYTTIQRPDGTAVASIAHENPEKFFPNVERFLDE
jgi:hypothetical protein